MKFETVPFETLLAEPIRNGLTKPKSVRGSGVRMISMGEIFANDHIRDIDMDLVPVTDKEYKNCCIANGDLLFARQSLVLEGAGKCSIVDDAPQPTVFESHLIRVRVDLKKANPYFLFYYFNSYHGKENIKTIVEQVAAAGIRGSDLKKLPVPNPTIDVQNRITVILKKFDDKIALNQKINENLEHQAQALFDEMFSGITSGENKVGDYIMPKRGKTLLSKNAQPGSVPVIAGGLTPSVYHSEANTTAPVITISASGANAGYVNLWNTPVWSSDSSFIDSSMTHDVYFWFVFLRKRQKEIFDAQTGSAQPHIYPRHIGELPMGNFSQETVKRYTAAVEPLFNMIGSNKEENTRLAALRDALLPKLMSGELDVSAVEV